MPRENGVADTFHLYLDLKDKYPDRTYVLRYEDLVQNPIGIAGEIFDFFNVPLTDQTREFLAASTSASQSSYYSVYKTADVTEKWKSEFDPYIAEEILADLKGTRLEFFVQ